MTDKELRIRDGVATVLKDNDVPGEMAEALGALVVQLARAGFSPPVLGSTYLAGLSRQESKIVEMLCAGHVVKDIATRLDLSPHTIRNHLKAIFRKKGVRTQMQLLLLVKGQTA
jgi:DNA-binding NarL/FixJ family response regulator